MPIASAIFSTDPGKILDFGGVSAADIFNQTILQRHNSFDEHLSDPALAQPEPPPQPLDLFQQPPPDPVASVMPSATPTLRGNEGLQDYAIPVPPTQKQINAAQIKLSNYGYASDSSPDYNSNVLRRGNHNNRLEDGVSAALSASLAKRYGIPVGAEFEIVTSDGKTMKRRYDDTVPSHYKGKPLPETVDLFNLNGSNSFGGIVVDIRPITK